MAWGYRIRNADWNYGGSKFKLSRSKIDLFLKCQRCFYLDNKLGLKRPETPPFKLNSAVDALLKKEFDIYRAHGTPHPLMDTYGVDAKPFSHKDLDEWRENFIGIQYYYEPIGLTVSGAIDDIWVNPAGELIVVDYKATSKDEEITLDDAWKIQYKRQLEFYQWLLRMKRFTVSDTGYFVYANGRTDHDAFDGKLEFDVTLIPHVGATDWVEKALLDAKKCLDASEPPSHNPFCDYCCYVKEVAVYLPAAQKPTVPAAPEKSAAKPVKKPDSSAGQSTLF